MEQIRRPYQNRIVTDPEILIGKPSIRGTRIAVEHVLEQLADNPDMTELFEVFPDLSVEDVQTCLAFLTPASSTCACVQPQRFTSSPG